MDNPLSFTVTKDDTYNATFRTIDAHNVTVSAQTGSVISSTGGTVTGSGTYYDGDTVTLTATPKAGYKFSRWSGNGISSTSSTYSFTVTSDMSSSIYIFGIFEPNETETTEQVETVFLANEAGTKTFTLSLTPKSSSAIYLSLRRGTSIQGGPTITAGTASTNTQVEHLTIAYDGNKTFTLTCDGGNASNLGVAAVRYTY